ncbi:MAG: hypothetical protein Q7J69_03575 [Candidatus Omnitrophota bacterium]|nr:hypothetical protein [Candidatus Omnitrophota bacterium]
MGSLQRWLFGICAGLSLFLGVAGLIRWQEKISAPRGVTSLAVPTAPALPVQSAPWPEPAQTGSPPSSDSSEPDRSKAIEQQEIDV